MALPGRTRGFALVMVLWALAILTLIASAMLLSLRQSAGSSAAALEQVRLTALKEAVLTQVVVGLLDRRIEERLRVDGVPQQITVLGVPVTVQVQDEYGKVDLNAVPEEVLVRLFIGHGLPPDEAAALADKVMDWREPGDAKRLNGAKADDYRAAGRASLPRGAPFATIDELLLVMDMTQALYDEIRPALTIYSGRPTFNPQTAPPEALVSLPGVDIAQAGALSADRGGENIESAGNGPIRNGRVDPAISTAGWPFSVKALFIFGDRSIEITTVLRLSGDPRRPYWVQLFHE